MDTTLAAPARRSIFSYPWVQLVIGVTCMVMIANLQYGWTFFVPDIQKKFGWDRASIQIAFTLFALFETWLVPIEGWFVDKYGPRIVIFFGGLLCAIGWIMNAYASSLTEFYIAQIIAGIGAGAVYGTCIGNALKWFPGRRGFAAGLTAAGFGAGSAATVVPIQAMIKSDGFQATFFNFGLGQGVIICVLAFFMFAPKPGQVSHVISKAAVIQSRRQFRSEERRVGKECDR
jgi:OFA family oxalate/formate antiporter-like MFS transporter